MADLEVLRRLISESAVGKVIAHFSEDGFSLAVFSSASAASIRGTFDGLVYMFVFDCDILFEV